MTSVKSKYRSILNTFFITHSPEEADFFVLPMSWNYYSKNNKRHLAVEFINKVRCHRKPILSFMTGDTGVAPIIKDIYIFRPSGYKSKKLLYQHALPVFIDDPLMHYFKRSTPWVRKREKIPVIGFCGQASISGKQISKHLINNTYKNVNYFVKLSDKEPQSLYPPGLRRWQCLKILESSQDLKTNFIKRRNYRAGALDDKGKRATSIEFYNNMINSDYVLCVRGAGNFSVRLYETLAMGRIPVFVNTDCLLPFEEIIDWNNYVVWVQDSEIKSLPQKIKSFHDKLSASEFERLQFSCRKLWEEYFSFNGYINHFHKLFITSTL